MGVVCNALKHGRDCCSGNWQFEEEERQKREAEEARKRAAEAEKQAAIARAKELVSACVAWSPCDTCKVIGQFKLLVFM